MHQYRKLIEGMWKVLEHKHRPDTTEHAVRRQSGRKIYKNNICPNCNSKEDTDHIYSGNCPGYHKQQTETAGKIREYLKQNKILPAGEEDRLLLWIPDLFPPYLLTQVARDCWRELKEYSKSYGSIGMCPIALKKLIQGEDSSYHIRKILEIIREGALKV